jgi:hypothetical protein
MRCSGQDGSGPQNRRETPMIPRGRRQATGVAHPVVAWPCRTAAGPLAASFGRSGRTVPEIAPTIAVSGVQFLDDLHLAVAVRGFTFEQRRAFGRVALILVRIGVSGAAALSLARAEFQPVHRASAHYRVPGDPPTIGLRSARSSPCSTACPPPTPRRSRQRPGARRDRHSRRDAAAMPRLIPPLMPRLMPPRRDRTPRVEPREAMRTGGCQAPRIEALPGDARS